MCQALCWARREEQDPSPPVRNSPLCGQMCREINSRVISEAVRVGWGSLPRIRFGGAGSEKGECPFLTTPLALGRRKASGVTVLPREASS